MLDNILNSVKRGAERVQRRGEEVAQVARLKMEVFQLTRELDGHYARLGRAYHAGAEADLLHGVRDDIRKVEEEIRNRERLIDELGVTPEEAAAHAQAPQAGPPSQTYTSVPQLHSQVSERAPGSAASAQSSAESSSTAPSSTGSAATAETASSIPTPPNSTLGNSPKFTEQSGNVGESQDKGR